MKGNKEVISVSTDISGLPSKLEEVAEVYGDCNGMVDWGVEVICWRGINKDYFEKARQLGIRVNGLHGPVNAADESFPGSWLDRLKGRAIDGLMIGSDRIQEISLENPAAYVLVHQNLVNSPDSLEGMAGIARGFDGDTVLLVENLNESGSITNTMKAVEELSGKGIRTGIMIDLVHLIKDLTGTHYDISIEIIDKYWGKVLSTVSQIAAKIQPVGFHIPVGLNRFDSLPVENMERQQWIDFAQLTAECPSVRFKTIENQRRNDRMPFSISVHEMKVLRPRNFRILTDLHETGVI